MNKSKGAIKTSEQGMYKVGLDSVEEMMEEDTYNCVQPERYNEGKRSEISGWKSKKTMAMTYVKEKSFANTEAKIYFMKHTMNSTGPMFSVKGKKQRQKLVVSRKPVAFNTSWETGKKHRRAQSDGGQSHQSIKPTVESLISLLEAKKGLRTVVSTKTISFEKPSNKHDSEGQTSSHFGVSKPAGRPQGTSYIESVLSFNNIYKRSNRRLPLLPASQSRSRAEPKPEVQNIVSSIQIPQKKDGLTFYQSKLSRILQVK